MFMRPSWNIADLEVVGYANVFGETMLPTVAPPVFRFKADATRALLPPYHLNGAAVYNATAVSQAELEELRAAREITLFDDSFAAQANYELWIDQSFQRHYQPLDEAESELGRIAERAIHEAEEALRQGNLADAERLSGVAISANDRRVEPLAINAAISRLNGDAAGERLMAELAASALEARLFKMLVDEYCKAAPRRKPAAPASDSGSPMRQMACMAA